MIEGLIVIGVFGLLFFFAIIKNVKNPPREIDFGEVDEVVQLEIKKCIPEFQSETVRFLPAVKKYQMKGVYKGNPVRVEAEMTKAGLFDELELKDISEFYSQKRGAAIKSINEIPEPILNIAFSMLGESSEAPEFVRGYHATFLGKAGYDLRLNLSTHRYEFEIREDGRILEFEKERRR